MEQDQIQCIVEKAIQLLSEINQKPTVQKCQLSPALQKEIDEAGVLRVDSTTTVEALQNTVPFMKVLEKCGDFSKIEYYCFVPIPNLLGDGYRLFGIDGGRNVVVVYDDYPKTIKDNDQQLINYSFLVSAK